MFGWVSVDCTHIVVLVLPPDIPDLHVPLLDVGSYNAVSPVIYDPAVLVGQRPLVTVLPYDLVHTYIQQQLYTAYKGGQHTTLLKYLILDMPLPNYITFYPMLDCGITVTVSNT